MSENNNILPMLTSNFMMNHYYYHHGNISATEPCLPCLTWVWRNKEINRWNSPRDLELISSLLTGGRFPQEGWEGKLGGGYIYFTAGDGRTGVPGRAWLPTDLITLPWLTWSNPGTYNSRHEPVSCHITCRVRGKEYVLLWLWLNHVWSFWTNVSPNYFALIFTIWAFTLTLCVEYSELN